MPFSPLLERLAWESLGRLPGRPTGVPLWVAGVSMCLQGVLSLAAPPFQLAAWIRSFPQQRLRCASTAFASWRPGGADSAAPHLPQAWAPLKARARTLRCAFDFPEEGNGDPGEVGEASAAVPTVFPGGTKTPQVLLPGTSRSPASGWRGGVGNGRQKLLEAGSGVRLPGLDTMGCRILSTPSSVSAVPVSLCLSLFFFFFGLGFHYFLRLHLHAFPLPNSHRRATGGCGGAVAAAAAARRLRGRGGGGGSQEAGLVVIFGYLAV